MSLAVVLLCAASRAGAVSIVAHCDQPGQTWEGWGTTDLFSFDGLQVEPEAGKPGEVSPQWRQSILKLYYRDLGMTRVRFWPMGYEPVNDNDDPHTFNWNAFVWKGRGTRPVNSVDPFCEDHLVTGRAYRTPGEPFTFYPSAHQWESWMTVKPDSPMWFWGPDARFNPAMVEEYAEHALAAVLHVKQAYGYEIPSWSLFNEPTNTAKIDKETTLALVLACGRRFKEYNLKTRLSVCDDVTPEASAKTIEHVLKNREARGYVGAISYHRYCGDFVLERVKPMLAKVARGERLVSSPVSFYETATRYGKSVWLSEQCSYGDQGITHFDAGRARANHICDETNYGLVNAFDFMLCYFVERGKPGNEEAPIFLRFKDGKCIGAEVNAFGAWISHFTRYIRPGAVRLVITSEDNMLNAVAFRHTANGTLTVVVINNRPERVNLSLHLSGVTEAYESAERIRTSPGKLRRKLADVPVRSNAVTDMIPGTSVISYVLR